MPLVDRAAGGRPPGLDARVLEFVAEMRDNEIRVGTAEVRDALDAVAAVEWARELDFREALAACLAKSRDDRSKFDALFDRFFFRRAEEAALEREPPLVGAEETTDVPEAEAATPDATDLASLRIAVFRAIEAGDEARMRDLAQLAIASFGRGGEAASVVGLDMQHIRRGLGLTRSGAVEGAAGAEGLDPGELPQDGLARFERALRRELERRRIKRMGELPPSRPLSDFDRSLPSSPLSDLASVHRVVAQLKRRLATQGNETRGRRRSAHVDIRRTLRASLETGGVPLRLKHRPRRPRRPEIYVLCDVSTSVSSASLFFLSVLHALHDSFRKLRSFVFVERVSEVTDVFERTRDFSEASQAITKSGGVADLTGYTDYGRVWHEFYSQVVDDLDPRSTVIVMGDARTNGREPHERVFATLADRAKRTLWLNPEPSLYWNYGDSVMDVYARHCDAVFECWNVRQLEGFVRALAMGAR